MIDLNNLGTSLFATGIGAALITQCKGIFNSLKQFFRFGYYIYTGSETNRKAYYSLKNYIVKYKGNFQKTISFDNFQQDFNAIFGIGVLGYGNFIIHPKWYQLMIVSHIREKRDNGPTTQTLNVQLYGFKTKQLYEDIIKQINKDTNKEDILLRYAYNGMYIKKRSFDTIFHQKKEQIIKFLDNFKEKREIYERNGLPYKTGLLLYGPAGTGKTSIVKAIASYMGYSLLIPPPNGSSIEILDLLKPRTVVCIEDIDRLLHFENEEEKDITAKPIKKLKTNSTDLKGINNSVLHNYLQLFDGLTAQNEIIFIATTNHIEKLPPELIRDGRFDCKIFFDNIDKNSAEQMCNSFDVKLSDIVSKDQKYPINPAYLQNQILQKINTIKEI